MNELGGYAFADLRVGMCATFAKTVTEADIVLFAAVSGDNNAIHINEEFAAGTIFKGRIAHGLLSASVISAAIANKLPGPGSIYVSQSLRFQGACPGQRYCPCDRHGQRDDPSEISRLARHGLHGWRTGGDRGRGRGRTPCSLAPRISQSGRVRKRGCPCLGGRPRKRQQANSRCHATLVEPVQRRQQYRGEGNDDVIGNQHSERRPVQCWPG